MKNHDNKQNSKSSVSPEQAKTERDVSMDKKADESSKNGMDNAAGAMPEKAASYVPEAGAEMTGADTSGANITGTDNSANVIDGDQLAKEKAAFDEKQALVDKIDLMTKDQEKSNKVMMELMNENAKLTKELEDLRAQSTEKVAEVSSIAVEKRTYTEDEIYGMAAICHDANRAYCNSIGDPSQLPWERAEVWQRDSSVMGVRFRLENPDAPASAQHDAWMKQKVEEGWVYGPVKNADKKEHNCILPYNELPEAQKRKDKLFQAVVDSLK